MVLNHGGAVTEQRGRLVVCRIAPAQVVVIAGYYLLNWMRSGQTLGMRAWRLRAVTDVGQAA